ncbi:unnamed protein product, partial [Protopolystoma xenopodis]
MAEKENWTAVSTLPPPLINRLIIVANRVVSYGAVGERHCLWMARGSGITLGQIRSKGHNSGVGKRQHFGMGDSEGVTCDGAREVTVPGQLLVVNFGQAMDTPGSLMLAKLMRICLESCLKLDIV